MPRRVLLARRGHGSTAGLGWLAASTVYLLAVLNRTSLGVAAPAVERRFDLGPAALTTFVFLQIGVYAAMQIPAGLLVDRYGPRRLLLTASVTFTVVQAVFATTTALPVALVARGVLGCGDALVFISVLRFTASHFSTSRYPYLVTFTALLGTVGNTIATLPLSHLLASAGWGTGFLTVAALSAIGTIAVALCVPGTEPTGSDDASTTARAPIRTAWAVPGTRMAFWLHFTAMATATPLAVLWGIPYLTQGVGISTRSAAVVLMVAVIVSGIANPVLGGLIGRWPRIRVPLGLAFGVTSVAVLAMLVCLGDRPPSVIGGGALVFLLLGMPVSAAAFPIARDYNHSTVLGVASGLANVGGFLATVIGTVAFGVALQAQGAVGPHSMRLALLVFLAVQAAGCYRLISWYRRVRAEILARQRTGLTVPVPLRTPRWFDHDPARFARSS